MAAKASFNHGEIYSATYSSVPVYEFCVGSDTVMRRRSDDWINATHILKAAGLDKPSRTRILEREVQKGVHEKIQGGYGKYQGTWVPLDIGQHIAVKNGILERLLPIFNYLPGDHDGSPPPAPRHQGGHAKLRNPQREKRTSTPLKSNTITHPPEASPHSTPVVNSNNNSKSRGKTNTRRNANKRDHHEDETEDHTQTPIPRQDEEEVASVHQSSNGGFSSYDQNHIIYGDQLLDYFMTVGDAPTMPDIPPPVPPPNFEVDNAIDDQGNTALHWACSMGDLGVVRDLISRGANVGALSKHDETPLVRAILFTNNYEKGTTMPELVGILSSSITFRDWFGATIFHHLAATTKSKGKWKSARYYCQILLDKLKQIIPPAQVQSFLAYQDSNGDTSALVAAKNGCFRLAALLLAYCPEAGQVRNKNNETADEFMRALTRRQKEPHFQSPSKLHAQHNINLPDVTVTEPPEESPKQQRRQQPSQPDSTPRRQENRQPSQSDDSTIADTSNIFLAKVGTILEGSAKKLEAIFGLGNQGSSTISTREHSEDASNGERSQRISENEDSTNPQDLLDNLETDRENIRRQVMALESKKRKPDELDGQERQFKKVRGDFETLLEQVQYLEIMLHSREAEKKQKTSNMSSSSSPPIPISQESNKVDGDGDGDGSNNQPSMTPPSSKVDELKSTYETIRKLQALHSQRLQSLRTLTNSCADAGVSAKLDVHRKLVGAATGIPENVLDPMSSELADALEFERNGGPRSLTSMPNSLAGLAAKSSEQAKIVPVETTGADVEMKDVQHQHQHQHQHQNQDQDHTAAQTERET